MDEGHVIVGANDIAQCREAFFDPLDNHLVGERISQVLELLVCGGVGDQQASDVSDRRSADVSSAANRGVDDGNVVHELGFQSGIEILGTTNSGQSVRVGQGRKDADL